MHKPIGEWTKSPPYRIRVLSFDIECAGRSGIFLQPQYDPIIQIANIVVQHGTAEPFVRNIFTLNTCQPIDGAHVLSYHDEVVLLDKWLDFVREIDPDIITGYNINNFDTPYLLLRAQNLHLKNFHYLGRIKNIW